MSIIRNSIRFALTLLLPYLLLINLIGFVSLDSDSNFINIIPTSFVTIANNWNNGFFGLSSFLSMLENLGTYDFSKLLADFQKMLDLTLAGIPTTIVDFGDLSILEYIKAYFKTLLLLLVAPITTGFQSLVLLVDVLRYLYLLITTFGYAIGGYYNVQYEITIDNTDWNSISTGVYALKNVLLL